jgi:ferredoxin-NADP reductase
LLAVHDETPRTGVPLGLAPAPLAGQHYVLSLTAPDGYTAQRSYSVASAPDDSGKIELTVEKLDGGEVSSFLHDIAEIGDEIEVRGPIGRWFVWEADTPALLIGGGSGVVPLMSMLRLARRIGRTDLLQVVVSVRTPTISTTPTSPASRRTSCTRERHRPARRARRAGSRQPTSRR